MSDTGTAVPSSGGDASAPSSTGDTGQSSASVPAGIAPGGDGDAGVAGGATESAASSPAAQFTFLRRQFRDPRHAEEVLGSEIGMTRGLQRQNAELSKRLQALEAALSMRDAGVQVGLQGQGQNVPQGGQPPGGSKSFAQELAQSGELELIAQMAADPNMGIGHAMYRMAELLEQREKQTLGSVREELLGTVQQQQVRSQQERVIANAFGVVKKLAQTYPELDESYQTEEAEAAQQGVVDTLKEMFTPEQIARNPERTIRLAVEEYRRMNGTPVFAQAPGSSGSPSAKAAAAAEAMGNATASALDGSGVPRQRANGQPESPIERLRRENREISTRVAKTPSGRPLGFEA